jgi:hypothetical protein
MSDLFWLTDDQTEFFPKSHGKPRVDAGGF